MCMLQVGGFQAVRASQTRGCQLRGKLFRRITLVTKISLNVNIHIFLIHLIEVLRLFASSTIWGHPDLFFPLGEFFVIIVFVYKFPFKNVHKLKVVSSES